MSDIDSKSENSSCEFDFIESLGNVLDKRYDSEAMAYNNMITKHENFEEFPENVRYRLIQKESARLYQEGMKRDIEKKKSLRTIKTLRTRREIKNALREGKQVLKQKVHPARNIRVTYALIWDRTAWWRFETVPYTFELLNFNPYIVTTFKRYPHTFPSKFAAYIIPDDLIKGEKVILNDLIEDIVAESHDEGTYRLKSAEAVWNGEKFVVDCDSYNVEITFG